MGRNVGRELLGDCLFTCLLTYLLGGLGGLYIRGSVEGKDKGGAYVYVYVVIACICLYLYLFIVFTYLPTYLPIYTHSSYPNLFLQQQQQQ